VGLLLSSLEPLCHRKKSLIDWLCGLNADEQCVFIGNCKSTLSLMAYVMQAMGQKQVMQKLMMTMGTYHLLLREAAFSPVARLSGLLSALTPSETGMFHS